jgi:hypothetical protein
MDVQERLDDLRILVFWEILKTGDHTLLDFERKRDTVYTEEQKAYLKDVWNDLYDNYFEIKKDGKSQKYLNEINEQLRLAAKIEMFVSGQELIQKLIDNVQFIKEEDYQKLLKSTKQSLEMLHDGMTIPDKGTVKFLNRAIGAFISQYNRLSESVDKKTGEAVQNVYEVVAVVSNALNMQLNAAVMTVTEWLAYEQMAIKKSKSQKKNGTR